MEEAGDGEDRRPSAGRNAPVENEPPPLYARYHGRSTDQPKVHRAGCCQLCPRNDMGHAGHLWPGLPNGVINPTVSPARISFTFDPLVIACRKPTSNDSLSLTCQIAPINPERVCAWPNSSS